MNPLPTKIGLGFGKVFDPMQTTENSKINSWLETLLAIIKNSDLIKTEPTRGKPIIKCVNVDIIQAFKEVCKEDESFELLQQHVPWNRYNSVIGIGTDWASLRLDIVRQIGYLNIDLVDETIVVSIESDYKGELSHVACLDWTDLNLTDIIRELLSDRLYFKLNEIAYKFDIKQDGFRRDTLARLSIAQISECHKTMANLVEKTIDKVRTAAWTT